MGPRVLPGLTPGRRRLSALASAVLLAAAAAPLRAAPADTPFPPATTFRSLQLTTLDCGRENTAAPCARAKAEADRLLDHPRLPGRCKDVLWEIRQRAVVAPQNSLERREAIDIPARDLTVFCRQQLRSKDKPAAPAAPAAGTGGFGFGAPPP